MRIYKRGDVYWAQFRNQRVSLKTSDRKAAEAAFRLLQQRATDPNHTAQETATLKEWADKMLAAKEFGRSAGTAHMYRVKVRHLLRVFGEHAPLTAVSPESVDNYVEQRSAEASNSTIGKELTALQQTLKLAKRAGAYKGDLSVLRPPDFSIDYKPRERVLLPQHEPALRAVCAPWQWGAIAFALATSARLSELLRAQPEDVDWQRREVLLRGSKTKASWAVIPIVELAGLAGYLAEAVPFLPVQWPHMSRELSRLCVKAQVPELSPNDLRRTTSTRLIEAGADPYDVAKITRHKTLTMLKRVYDRTQVSATRARIDRAGIGTNSVQSSAAGDSAAAAPIAKPV